MMNLRKATSRSALALLTVAVMSTATLAADLSRYRNFELGADLATIAKQTDTNVAQARVIHSRPALIQELQWSPQPLGLSSMSEAAKAVVFSFYNGKLFRVTVDYDRYKTEGLTPDDFADAISAVYGVATKPAALSAVTPVTYGERQDVVAQWQDSQYRFDLIRSSYGPTFQLVGTMKSLETSATAATAEAKRLDDQEAPQREAARLAGEELAAKTKLEEARLVNKPKFRP